MRGSELCDRWIEAARQILAALPETDLVAAFVYGSAAWGDAEETSDVDIMVLLDREDDFRQASRVQVEELVNMPPPAPSFADIDRISFERFRIVVAEGNSLHKVVNSVILADDGRYAAIRNQVSARFASLEERARRAGGREEAACQHLEATAQARTTDPSLALLHARLAAEEAGTALLEASGNRPSTAHYFDALERVLTSLNHQRLVSYLQRALALDCGVAGVQRGLAAHRVFADALQQWIEGPVLAASLGPEHVAWAKFMCGTDAFEEVDQKVEALLRVNREPEAVAYVDGWLKMFLRADVSKVLNLRRGGAAEILPVADFHVALRSEPVLYRHWLDGLRLDGSTSDINLAVAVTSRLRDDLPRVLAAPTRWAAVMDDCSGGKS